MFTPETKHEVTPVGPKALDERLTETQVKLVIGKHYHQVKSCHERQLKRDPDVAGKVDVVAKVRPNGKVQYVRIATKKFQGTFVDECLVKSIKQWEFPSFKGQAYELTFSLLLTVRL
jgi:hypothetical protein